MFSPPAPEGDVELSLTHTLVKVRLREGKRVATIHTVGTRRELKSAASHSTVLVDASTEIDVERGVILSGKSRAEAEGEFRQETPAPGADQPPLVISVATRQIDQTTVQLIETKGRK